MWAGLTELLGIYLAALAGILASSFLGWKIGYHLGFRDGWRHARDFARAKEREVR
jgi:hypothetical protein